MPLVNVSMARGRTPEQKAKMLFAISDAIHESIGAPRDSIRVWVTEFENTDFLAGTEVLADKQQRLAAEAEAAAGDATGAATSSDVANGTTP